MVLGVIVGVEGFVRVKRVIKVFIGFKKLFRR